MSYIRELERGRSFALFSFFSGEAKPGKPPLKDTLYSCFYIDGGVRANREPMTFILPPFADSPPLFTIEICGFSLSSGAAEKKPWHRIHEVLLRIQSCWVSYAPLRTVIEATLAHHRKFSGISSSREIGERANGEHSLRKKFEIQVKAFCADCTIFYQKPTCPPEHLFDDEFLAMLARARAMPRPRIAEWQRILRDGWVDRGYCNMDRHELAASVNPLLSRTLKPNTLWKYATERLALYTNRRPGPKPRTP